MIARKIEVIRRLFHGQYYSAFGHFEVMVDSGNEESRSLAWFIFDQDDHRLSEREARDLAETFAKSMEQKFLAS